MSFSAEEKRQIAEKILKRMEEDPNGDFEAPKSNPYEVLIDMIRQRRPDLCSMGRGVKFIAFFTRRTPRELLISSGRDEVITKTIEDSGIFEISRELDMPPQKFHNFLREALIDATLK